jgi:hypothetical protein
MGLFDFIDPIASAVLGGDGGGGARRSSVPVQMRPVPTRLTLPSANPDWNTATVKLPKPPLASQHGWSGNSLQSYLQNFQNLGGPAPGNQIATTASLFPNTGAGTPVAPDWTKLPGVGAATIAPASGSPDIIQSLVKNSVGGEMSPAAAALYGRMLGATPPPAVAAAAPSASKPPPSTVGGGEVFHGRGMQFNQYQQGFSAGQNSLYKGMTPLQKAQASAVYNTTQPVSPTIR